MISTPLIVFTKQSLWLANYRDKKWIYIKKKQKKRSNVESAEQRRFHTKDAWAGVKFAHAWLVVRNSHMHGLLCEIRICLGCCAKFAFAWAAVRNSHSLGLLCEIHTCLGCCVKFALAWAAVQNLHMHGAVVFQRLYLPHLAPNHTRFEVLDSWLPELWNGI